MVRADGPDVRVSIRAKFDGAEYPVEGSFAVRAISYSRIDRNTIAGTGRNDGVVSLTETATVDPDNGTLSLEYSFYRDGKIVASGVAVFEAAAE